VTKTYIIVALVSYLLGSIPFGYILVKLFLKQDIRATGSGNIGATNVARSGAKGLAIATLGLDAGKGALAVIVSGTLWLQFFAPQEQFGPTAIPSGMFTIGAFAAFFAILGHVFPVWLKFKGGKGVATAIGAFAFVAPLAALGSLALFLMVVGVTRFVSLGSILAAVAFPFLASLNLHHDKPFTFSIFTAAASLLVILKHHENIRRLIGGTENKFGGKKSVPPPEAMEKQV
jgi:acyl phosphate:glycerol-3-phosphate acyltransferase